MEGAASYFLSMHADAVQPGRGVLDGGQEKVADVLQTLVDVPQWPSLEASPVALAAARKCAAPYLHALLAHENLPRGQQIQALSRIEVMIVTAVACA